MASLTTLRSLFYIYVGTKPTDPMYPTATVDALLNAAAHKYIADVQQANPAYLVKTTTLNLAARTASLPVDFAGYVDVRFDDATGRPLREVRLEELDTPSRAAFAITGPDAAATLTASQAVAENATLYFAYRYQPADLVNPSDIPEWMPAPFHDLLAREAAVDGFGLGAEGAPVVAFLTELQDRRAQFWAHVMRRGTQPLTTRQRIDTHD